MNYKKYLSGVLAAAMVLNTGAVSVLAAGTDTSVQEASQTQTSSTPETVYVNSYDGKERSVSFNDHWRFYLGELNGAEAVSYNDSSWDDVTLPHDYSIDQGFSTAAPAEQESGYVLGGTGWYRKSFTLDESMQGKTVSIDFDGVYMNATVYLNGEKLGTHPYGYTPFSFVLPQDKLKFGSEENVITVKVDHKQPSSRWYSGSGIYRDVKLTVADPVHVANYGTTVTTPDIESGKGTVSVVTEVQNDSSEAADVSVKQTVYEKGSDVPAAEGEKTKVQSVAAGKTARIEASVTVADPKLWDTENPNLYTVKTEVYVGDTLKDSYHSDFGFRWVNFTTEKGFYLNGKNIKLHGVSMHHDQGSLGSEAWERSVERQVQELKQMGVNAIRVTHNPASQVLIDVCNREGIMLVEEAFDCWLSGKAGNTEDYGKWFYQTIESGNQIVNGREDEKWAEFDLKAMVRRGRNNPSIIMWSLGNEIFQQLIDGNVTGQYPEVAKKLITWTGEEDATRYVTFGDNQVKSNVWADNNQVNTALVFAEAAKYGVPGGLVGFNYGSSGQISNGHSRGWLVYGSETASSVNSRGVYDRKNSNSDNGSGDRRLTSYDKSAVGWGHLASAGLWITMQQEFNAGEFVWTGFDYIGEPTPYNWQGTGANGTWPNIAKNSYFGIIDTAGIPKDSYYLYQSQWNDNENTLHVLPVWNEDEIMLDNSGKAEVVVYSDAPVVKLYLNGKEIGSATATHTDTPTGGYQNYTSGTGCFDSSKANGHTSLYATFQVPYEVGTLEAKAFEADGVTEIKDTDGRNVAETTGKGSKLTVKADRSEITADGKDLSFVEIDVTDRDGREVNGAEPQIHVAVEGDGKLLSLDNGVQNDTTSYSEPTRKAGKGKLIAIVQSTKDAGSFTVKATSDGYTAAQTVVTTVADGSGVTGEKTVVSYEIAKNYYVKQGTKPVLPSEVKIHYSDDTSETKKVTWDAFTGEEETYSVSGTVADLNMRITVNVSTIGQTAGVLNYSAAVGKDAEVSLPAARPAVLADGTILAAEFPVKWDIPKDLTATIGTKNVKGTATVFDQNFEVTAAVRVTNGEYKDGAEALGNVPEMYYNGTSSKEDASVADVLAKLQDDKTSADDVAWSGKGTLDFRLDTAIELKGFTMYLKDTAPTSGTIKIYASGDNGVNWTPVDCTVTNKKEKGVTVRTYNVKETVSETYFRVEFTKDATLAELEMNTRIPSFTVGSEAALSSLKVGGHIADEASLKKGWFGVNETEFDAADLTAEGKDNASVTILDKDADGVIRILIESEDHLMRAIYPVMLGKDNTASDSASDASMDYDYRNMTLRAPSEEGSGSVAKAADGNTGTIWHTNWGSGSGPTDLRNDPDNRYLQIELKETEKINALRYLPRSSDTNGIVTEYSIKVSTDGENWTEVAKSDADSTWSKSVEWKLAQFAPVDAKYIRLYGVSTVGQSAAEVNKYMSAAEVRVRYAAQEIYRDNTTVTLEDRSFDYTGSALTPKPVVTYKASEDAQAVTLTEGTDYEVSYKNNTEPGTATIVVTGKGAYQGVVEENFVINAVDITVADYEAIAVTTAKGVCPALPGTVIAHTNVGDQVLDVQWDEISAEQLKQIGTFSTGGTVVDTNARITAEITVTAVIGVQQVSVATAKGTTPSMPETVTVYYSNGEKQQQEVVWDLADADFRNPGIVEVYGTVGKAVTRETVLQAKASVRVADVTADANNTPTDTNLALNADGSSKTREWPRTFAYFSSSNDLVYNAVDGNKNFDSTSGKKIWCDWESGKYHTNADAAVGDSDHLPFVISAFGKEDSTADSDQKKYTVNKVSIGFMEEDGSAANKVRLPKDYKIEYYSANDGVIPANRLGNDSANSCSNIKGWGADNPLKAHTGWTEVAYVGGKPSVPSLANFKEMVNVEFEAVETTAIRITLTPQDNNWTGLEEYEVYYTPIEKYGDYEVTSIKVDGQEVLAQFDADTKTLNLDARSGVITAQATNNASVTVLDAVNGTAKVLFRPENGDENKAQEYTVNFKQSETPEEDHSKDGLKAVIDLAEKLNAENYTAESYAKLTAALAAAKEVCDAENATVEEISAQISAISDAIKGLESADKAANEDLKKQLEEKTKQLEDKERELAAATENVTTLQDKIKDAQDQLAALEGTSAEEKTALEKQIEALQGKLNTARAEVLTLSGEKASLEEEKAALQAELKKVQDQAAKDSAEAEAAIKKAQEEARKAREEIEKLKDSLTLKNGDTVTAGGVQYRVTDAAAKTAEAYGTAKKNIKTINVTATVTIKDVTCKVTAIADQAFAGQKKATKAVIGANVTKIGKKAFYGDSRLKSITVKGKKLKMVGKQALKGINKHAVVRVPKAKKKAYKALFKGKGQKKSVKVK